MTIDILITGGGGQLGRELQGLSWPDDVRLHTPDRIQLDIADATSVAAAFATGFDVVINTAAYTAVDKAEAAAGDAFRANALGPALLADATRASGIPLIHVSTDYVFDGSNPAPYGEDDPVAPLGVYGASKLAGELAVRSGNPRSAVVRTAWLVSAYGSNFVKTMLRLSAGGQPLRVVDDQIGCPTAAADLAAVLQMMALRMAADCAAATGVYHFVNAGEASWCGLARLIVARAERSSAITGIATADYPTAARRPAYSRLATGRLTRDYGVTPRPWQEAIVEIVDQLTRQAAA